jgi:hypothetical protein
MRILRWGRQGGKEQRGAENEGGAFHEEDYGAGDSEAKPIAASCASRASSCCRRSEI